MTLSTKINKNHKNDNILCNLSIVSLAYIEYNARRYKD